MELKKLSRIDPKKCTLFLLYSRYWDFSKYANRYTKERTENQKKFFYDRLVEEHSLNGWDTKYLDWTIQKMNKLDPMVDPCPYIFKENAPHEYMIHLCSCFNLFVLW